jgi:predicted AAA+ superfamily ATPase
MISAQTTTRYIDLLVDLLLVRRLRPFHVNVGKRLVKSPKVYVRDSGILHALLGLLDYSALAGHPVVGESWEGFVIENLIMAAPVFTMARFYRTATGAEIDLVLEIPGQGLWAIDIKRGLSPKPERGFHQACADVKANYRFVVYSGTERYRITPETEAISLHEMAMTFAAL